MSTSSPFQTILDDSRFEGYLHPEVEGRIPVRVQCADACPDLAGVTKFGVPVERVEELGDVPFIAIQSWEESEDKVETRFRYEVEGVVAEFTLERGEDGWAVADAMVAES